jgi:ABC-type polysaccharide/polyol phosphate transport system ATPase subunit
MSAEAGRTAAKGGRCEIGFDDVGVLFEFDRLSRVLTPMLAKVRRVRGSSWGLRNVTASFEPGAGVALVGPTGSGKTTMLRLIAGIVAPDEGEVRVRGRIGSLLAIDAGLMPLLTGRENAELLGVLAGLSLEETRSSLELVEERSQLEDAFDRPVLTYSVGMRARLGFAVIQAIAADILLLDEVFEALDHSFRQIVEGYAKELRERGGIVVAAGHDHAALSRMCPRALLLDGGRVLEQGGFEGVIADYRGESAAAGVAAAGATD